MLGSSRRRPNAARPLAHLLLAALTTTSTVWATDGLTAYRGSDWAYLQTAREPAVLWLGTERPVALPATRAANVRWGDLVLLEPETGDEVEWAAAGLGRDADGPHFLLYAGRGGETVALPLPERPRPANRLAAVRWLASSGSGRLQGLAWLEATTPRTEELWLAPWGDGSFEPAVRLVAPGPGSQTGLDAAVLADGSWLLVWCAFDGEDDELVWRRRGPDGNWAGGLVAPDNGVPDIAPRLLVTRDGAALAWSRYDGRAYRVRTARFRDGGWRHEGWAGPSDSLYPGWTGDGDTLLYLEGATRTWAAVDDSESLRFGPATGATPVLERDGASGRLRALWPESSGWRVEAGRPAEVRRRRGGPP